MIPAQGLKTADQGVVGLDDAFVGRHRCWRTSRRERKQPDALMSRRVGLQKGDKQLLKFNLLLRVETAGECLFDDVDPRSQ